jgi:hypothetical protein
MPFVTLEGPDRQEHALLITNSEFGTYSRRISSGCRDAIWDHGEQRLVDAEFCRELTPRSPGHRDRVIGLAHRPTERDTPAKRFANVQSSMHCYHVRKIEESRSRGAIHRHREFVAVNRVDTVLAKEIYQPAHTIWIDRSPHSEHLGREPDAPEVVAEPSDPVRRANRNDRVPSAPQLLG